MTQQPFITLVDQILAAKKQHTPLSPLNRGEFKDADTSCPVLKYQGKEFFFSRGRYRDWNWK
jgi:hypothetical protein